MRIIFVPQYPAKMRYQEWWFTQFPIEFEKKGYEVVTLGKNILSSLSSEAAQKEMFSPIKAAIDFELAQINEYISMDILDDDILFLADLSFPGFFSNVLYHKKPHKCYAFCHATSLNNLDYFEPVRFSKFPCETAHANLFRKIFLGSYYHMRKLSTWRNTVVTYLPYPPELCKSDVIKEKKYKFCSASRPTEQKVDTFIEKAIEGTFNDKIVRMDHSSWDSYYSFLSSSKILLISAKEDTFGYQIIDAIINGCVPIAPNKLSYPEILPKEYLYDDYNSLTKIISLVLTGELGIPKVMCDNSMKNFYDELSYAMR
jgi:hypothetical protein